MRQRQDEKENVDLRLAPGGWEVELFQQFRRLFYRQHLRPFALSGRVPHLHRPRFSRSPWKRSQVGKGLDAVTVASCEWEFRVRPHDERIKELEKQIQELKERWPAHSVPPAMLQRFDDLEEELVRLKN